MPTLTINEDYSEKTLLSFLKKKYPFSLLSRLFRQQKILLNGKKAKKEDRLSAGDSITMPEAIQASVVTDQLLETLFENQDFAVINKPSGLAVHSGKSVTPEASLIDQLRRTWEKKGETPFLVHRLDTMTSGCLLIAKKKSLLPDFEHLFRQGQVRKEYLTLVKGIPEKMAGTITKHIPHHHGFSQNAETAYEVIEIFPDAEVSLLKASPLTGRKHQIRIHGAGIEHPLVMDHHYGDFEFNRKFQKKYRMKRFLLHAEKLSFSIHDKSFTFSAPLPRTFKEFLKLLRMGK